MDGSNAPGPEEQKERENSSVIRIDKRRFDIKWRDPNTLSPNPLNHRRHPDRQKNVMLNALTDEGWIDPIIYNKRSGRIIDGHLRVDEAIAHNVPQVPVIELDVDDATERKILVRHDRIGSLADIDWEQLGSLIDSVDDDGDLLGWASGEVSPFIPFDQSNEPISLPPAEEQGLDDRTGRFVIVYESEAERDNIMQLLGITDAGRVLWTAAELLDDSNGQ